MGEGAERGVERCERSGGGRRTRGEGRKKADWKKINNMRDRGGEVGTGGRENKRQIT